MSPDELTRRAKDDLACHGLRSTCVAADIGDSTRCAIGLSLTIESPDENTDKIAVAVIDELGANRVGMRQIMVNHGVRTITVMTLYRAPEAPEAVSARRVLDVLRSVAELSADDITKARESLPAGTIDAWLRDARWCARGAVDTIERAWPRGHATPIKIELVRRGGEVEAALEELPGILGTTIELVRRDRK